MGKHATRGAYFTAPSKAWLWFLAVAASIDGAIWVVLPGTVQTGAYRLATDLAPYWVWGWAMSLAGAGAWTAAVKDGEVWAPDLARFSLAVYMVCCFGIGLSVFWLTFSGFESAATGAFKWWGVSFVCFVVLVGPTMTRRGGKTDLIDYFRNTGEWTPR